MLLAGSWRRQRLVLVRISRSTRAAACHTSVVMLPVISNKIVVVIAHSADVATTALQHVHGTCRLHC